jgi:hypothetical protein
MTQVLSLVRIARLGAPVLALAAAFVIGGLPATAIADGNGRHGSSLRQAGPDSRHGARNDRGYGKRYDNSRGNHGSRGSAGYSYRDRGHGNDRYGGSHGRSERYAYPQAQHYHYARPPVQRHGTVYRPAYYPRHYYPPVHYVRRPLPRYTTIHVSGYPYPYYYDAGVFYRPYGSNFWISVTAPIGARVHALPAGYVTLGYGGRTYYSAHSTYYVYDQPARQYVVVEPPPGAPAAGTASPPSSGDLFVYPARGQSEETSQRDRYECHLWSVSEVGVDPSYGQADDRDLADYRRALTACLEGRGYTVR